MSSIPPPNQEPQQQPGQNPQPNQSNLPTPASLQQVQQWEQQMSAMEQRYNQQTGARYNYQYQSPDETAYGPSVPPLTGAAQSVTGAQQLGRQLAERYGIAGRAPLVDAAGNFNRMPNSADEAAKFQYIGQALANLRAEQNQAQAVAAQQASIGLVQSNARGSLAAMQSGQYQSLAQTYLADTERVASMQPDFSYFIEKEMQERQEKLIRDQMRFQKKQAKYAMWGAIAGAIVGGASGQSMASAGSGAQAGATIGGGFSYY